MYVNCLQFCPKPNVYDVSWKSKYSLLIRRIDITWIAMNATDEKIKILNI